MSHVPAKKDVFSEGSASHALGWRAISPIRAFQFKEAHISPDVLRCRRWVRSLSPLGQSCQDMDNPEPFCVEFAVLMETAAHGQL